MDDMQKDSAGCRKPEKSQLDAAAMYRAAIETSADGFWLSDAEGHILEVNNAYVTLSGYTRKELLAMRIPDLEAKENPAETAAHIEKIIREGSDLFETLHRTKNGAIWQVEVNASYWQIDGGRFFSFLRDITERKKAEKKLEQFHTFFQTATDLMCIADPNGAFLKTNPACSEVLGYSEAELVSRPFIDFIHPDDKQPTCDEMTRQLQRGYSLNFENRYICKDGSLRSLSWKATYNKEDELTYAVARDITEQKRAEEELREKESKYQMLFEVANDGIFIQDDTGFIDCNQRGAEMYGLQKEKIIGRSPAEFAPERQPDGRLSSEVAEEKTRAALSGVPQLFEWQPLRADGTPFDVEITLSRLDLGGAVCLQAIVRDIADHKKQADELKNTNKRYDLATSIGKVGIWDWNPVTGDLIWNNETFLILGLEPGAIQPSFELFLDMLHPEDKQALNNAVQEALRGKKQYSVDCRVILRNGEERICHATGEVEFNENDEPVRMLGTFQDITERKRMEDVLQTNRQQLTTLIEALPDAVFLKDAESRWQIVNTAAQRLFQVQNLPWQGKNEQELMLMQPELQAAYQACMESDEQAWHCTEPTRAEELIPDEDGHLHTFDVIKVPLFKDDGGRKGLVIVGRDITDRKHAEEKIRQSEEFVRNILDTVDEGFIVINRDYRILTANRAFYSLVGGFNDKIIGGLCHEITHKLNRPCYEEGEDCAVKRVFETGKPQTALHLRKDATGNILYVETKAYPIKDAFGSVTSVIQTINNITEKHLLEEERLKIQKLESIGTLAGGIAHDFNNLLQGVFGYISMAKMTHDQKEKSLAMLDQAEEALHMSVNLTTQLLTFSKGGKPIKKLLKIEPAIESAVKFALSGSHTDYRLDMDPDLSAVEADAGQLAQVIQNIVMNANEAMAGKGTVIISAHTVDIPSNANPRLIEGGQFIRIDIQDSGIGIPEQNLTKIFDPYFTTKQRGSGLGLATSYSIIRNHGGVIEVKSEPNRGTTFTIYLPAATGTEIQNVTTTPSAVGTKKGRVLLMDDEELVRNVAREMIDALGHDVVSAEDGKKAIDLFLQAREAGRPFDLIILDLTVKGGMGGEEAIRKIREIDPQVKAVVSSGYADSPVVADYRAYGFSAFLNKPYKIDSLRESLNALIES